MKSVIAELESLKPVNLDAGRVFSGQPSGTQVSGYENPTSYTPAVDPDYIFHDSSRDLIVWFLNPIDPLYVFGPTGCGKTSCIKQLAARLNYPVFEVTGHGRLEFTDMVGHHTIHNGNMEFEYGPLSLAMKYGGLFLLNEIDLTSPDVSAGLNSILDGSPLCIADNGGELVSPHPNFRFAATANTNGGGDETGLYQGTQRQNLAFADRFMLCEISYPQANVEETLLNKKYHDLPAQLCKTMVAFANEVRKLFMGESDNGDLVDCLEVTFSTRSLLRWADLTLRFQPLARQGIQPVTYALDRALAYRASRESRAMLHELAQRMFPQISHDKNATKYNANLDTIINVNCTGKEGVEYLNSVLSGRTMTDAIKIVLRKEVQDAMGSHYKEWVGEPAPASFVINFGKAGHLNQQRVYRLDQCLNNDSLAELKRRAAKKLREGYFLIPQQSAF